MAGLDGRAWADGLGFRSFGRSVGVRVSDPELLDRVAESCLPPEWHPWPSATVDRLFSFEVEDPRAEDDGAGPLYRLHDGRRPLIETRELEGALSRLEAGIRWYIAEHARGRVFVHAGAVGWKGRAIVLPGESYSGKTNLVAALIRAGASYYSDECAVFDDRGWVHPYSLPLSIRRDGRPESDRRAPEAIGARVGREPIPTGLIVLAHYQRGARWRPERVGPGVGIRELWSQSAPARSRPRSTMAVLDRVVRSAPVVRGIRGEADEVASELLNALD